MRWKRIVVGVAVVAAVLCLLAVLAWRWLHPPLPFTGPRSGWVVDAATGQPVAGATVRASWTCHDNPLPDGPGHVPVSVAATTDAAGAFTLAPPSRRGGRFGTDSILDVTAKGYIKAVFIVDPNNTPLPQSTVDWPFADTTVRTSLPESMTIRLQPAGPVLLEAAQSSDPLIRETAEERLQAFPP